MTGLAKSEVERAGVRLAGREGFVIPAVIFAIVLMSTLAVAALLTADGEQRSSRAVRESVFALYAAEAGLNEVWATWDDTLVQNLNPGDSLDLGWRTLPNGSTYRAVIYRFDNGGQQMFGMNVEGRGRGALGGQRVLTLSLSNTGGSSICCEAGVKGQADFEIEWATVNGFDSIPNAWDNTICPDPLEDIPGMVWDGNVDLGPGRITGNPPLVEDTTIDATNLFDWGSLNYDSLVAMADITLTGDDGTIAPTLSGGACDTSNRFNWGAPDDPSHPCFDYFPIIHADELRIRDGSIGQGILLVDQGLEIEPDGGFNFYGIVISKKETELEETVTIYGGLIVDGEFEAADGPTIQYSSCAVKRALEAHNLTGGVELLSSRFWGEVLR